MSTSMAIAPKSAKIGTEACVGNRLRALRLNASVMRKSRDLFSVKTAHHLSEITGYSTRSCEAWLSEKVVIPSDALAELLHSEWGREFLATVMADSQPRWWKQLKAWWKSIDIREIERKLRRQRRELLDAEFGYETAATAAQMFSDPDFYGAQVAPVGRDRRALDSKRGK
jgi:hypothetical protein